jgi:hypothetical protein
VNRSPDCCCYRYPSHVECPACLDVIREAGRAEAKVFLESAIEPYLTYDADGYGAVRSSQEYRLWYDKVRAYLEQSR